MFQEYMKRLGALMAGQVISAIGITMILNANIGPEPWSVLQQGMSVFFGMTYGTAAMIVGAAVIAVAFLMGEGFGIGTLASIFICPALIDILLAWGIIPQMHGLISGILMLLAGMELLALGTWLYMLCALGAGPRDALMVVLARKTGRSVGFCRAVTEVIVVLAGWRLGGPVGIGTVIASFGVGMLFNLNFRLLHFHAVNTHQENLPETIRRIRGAGQAAGSVSAGGGNEQADSLSGNISGK